MTLFGRRITTAMAEVANKVLRPVDKDFGTLLKNSQDQRKKLAVGAYDYTVDAATFTFTNGDVDLDANTVTKAGHGLKTGDAVVLSSAGTLPTGVSTSTAYYVIYVNSSTFKLATTRANAYAGTAIDLTAKTGNAAIVHTLVKGVFGQISLLKDSINPNQPMKLPDTAIITRSYYKVYTTFTSTTTDNATIALSLNAANDITTATAIKTAGDIWDAAGVVAGAQDNAVANMLVLTADRELLMTVGADTLTAGKIKVFVEYIDTAVA